VEPEVPITDSTDIRSSSRATKNKAPVRLHYSPKGSKEKKREKHRKKSSEIKHLNGDIITYGSFWFLLKNYENLLISKNMHEKDKINLFDQSSR
jgi:hypothetical protein